ncbi:MAG: glycosyltransferase family 1 protein [Patescibacteria group bacterium]
MTVRRDIVVIGIDASRANKDKKTGTEWYSYFVIEEMKKLDFSRPYPSSALRASSPARGEEGEWQLREKETVKFILYSREPLRGDLGKLPLNFENRVLAWPPKFLWTQIRLSWEMLVRPPDVLFVPAHTLPVFGRAKKIVTIHDVGFRVYPEFYSWIDIFYHRFSVWFASKFAHKIICISEFTKSELIKYYRTDPKKIVVIPLGIYPSSVLRTPSPTRGEGGTADPFLLFIGRLEKKKNILGIIKAFELARKKIQNLRLVFAGLPGHGFEVVQKYLTSNNLREVVEIKGYIDEAEKQQLYARAFAFVFPTFYEGFGLPILEAQSRSCPVITSKFGAAAEVAGDSAILVDPNNPQQIGDAIISLQDPVRRNQIIQKGLVNCAKYSWENTAKATLKVLSEF